MKNLFAVLALVLLSPINVFARDVTTRLAVDGMHCPACPPAVTKSLRQVPGVKDVATSATDGTATVVADESVATSTLVDAVKKAGFSAKVTNEK
jgi:copper chaperone CopZ